MERNYQGIKVKDAWFILTDLGSLPVAIQLTKADGNRRNVPRL